MNLNEIQNLIENDGIIFLSYGGFLSQNLISGMTEALEKETKANDVSMGIASNIFVIFIELSQNMMNYSKSKEPNCSDLDSSGLIVVSKDKECNYFIHSQNIVSAQDKELLEPKLQELISLDKDTIKKRYRELRRSGKNTHLNGGGIGFFEIAKRCSDFQYEFKEINEDRFYFHIKTQIN